MTEYIQEKVGNMLTACTALRKINFRLILSDFDLKTGAGADKVRSAAAVLQHDGHGRVGRRGVLQHSGGAAAQEARH